MPSGVKLSDQQYKMLSVLWEKGEASAKDVQATQVGQALAHTTVATILSRLEKRGILSSRTRGRERVYKPLVDEASVKQSMVSSLVSTFFQGDKKALLDHLIQDGEIDRHHVEKALRKKQNN